MSANVQRPVTAGNPVHEAEFSDEWSPRYGFLMGGPVKIDTPGIGDFSTGHPEVRRRAMIEYRRIRVGRRNDSPEALADDSPALHEQWDKNPARLRWKSPRECASDHTEAFAHRGFIVPPSLTGLAYEEAEALVSFVLPAKVAALPLVDVIAHLGALRLDENPQAETLRDQLLGAAYVAQSYITEYVRAIREEFDMARDSGKGKRGADEVDREYLRELKQPMPEDRPAQATLALGKEIAAAVSQKPDTSHTDALLAAILDQNRLKEEEIRLLKESMAATKEATPAETSRTSTRRARVSP